MEPSSFIAPAWSAIRRAWESRRHNALLIEILRDWILDSDLSSSDKQAAMEHLEKSDPIRKRLFSAATPEEFNSVIRSIGVPEGVGHQEELVASLRDASYRHAATRQERISRDDLMLVRDDLNRNIGPTVTDSAYLLRENFHRIQEVHHVLLGPGRPALGAGPGGLDSSDENGVSRETVSGNIGVVTGDLGIPLLTPWSDRLTRLFTPRLWTGDQHDWDKEYEAAFTQAQEEPTDESTDMRLENIVILCVEGHYELAKGRLLNCRDDLSDVALGCRIAFRRLLGTVYLHLGEAGKAKRLYDAALTELQDDRTIDRDGRQYRWLRRSLAHDLVQFNDPWSEDLYEDHMKMLNMPAWHTHPAIDSALQVVDARLTEATFREAVAVEGTIHIGNGWGDPIVHFKRAVAVAYLTGSHEAARNVRTRFAKRITGLLERTPNEELARLAVEQLLHAQEPDALRKFLRRHAHLARDMVDWAALAQSPRVKAHDHPCVDRINRSALAIAEVMGPYLDDETVDALNHEFSKRAAIFLAGGQDDLVRGRRYREAYFYDAFRAVERLDAPYLRKLVLPLCEQDARDPFHPWSILMNHEWTEDDRAAANEIVATYLSDEATDAPPDPYLTLTLWKIGSTFNEHAQQVESRLIELVDATSIAAYLPYLLDRHRPAVAEHVQRWTTDLLDGLLEDLRSTSSDGWRAIRDSADTAILIADAFTVYHDAVGTDHIAEAVDGMIQASENPAIDAITKSNVFSAVTKLVPLLSQSTRSGLKNVLTHRAARREEARSVESPFLGDLAPELMGAQARLVELRAAVEIPPDLDDAFLVLSGLTQAKSSRTVGVLLDVAGALVRRRQHVDLLLSGMYQYLQGAAGRPGDEARVARAILRSLPDASHPLRPTLQHRLSKLLCDGDPLITQLLLIELKESWADLDSHAQAAFLKDAAELATHPHRFTRQRAAALVKP